MPQIRVLLGHQQGHVFCLRENAVVIGRDPKSGIVLHPDSAASRRHAELFPLDGYWRLRDLGSVNGTAVNGRRVSDEVLRDKDEVVIGDNVFVFEDKDADAAHIAEAASRASGADSRGYQNRPDVQLLVHSMAQRSRQVAAELAKVVGAQTEIIHEMLTAIVAQGHVVFDATPSCIETTVLHALAEVLGLTFRPIEITRETRPRDVTGANGFPQVVLADGLNRGALHTQVVLLEAMQDYYVTIEGHTRLIEHPFIVLATQRSGPCNGAQALSEAQLDRFVISISARAQSDLNDGMLRDHGTEARTVALEKMVTARQIMQLQRVTRDLPVSDYLVKYAVRLVRATRPTDKHAPDFVKKHVHAGAGPRAAEDLVIAAKARAILQGRLFVCLEDLQHMACAVLRHRICTKFSATPEGFSADSIVEALVNAISPLAGTEG